MHSRPSLDALQGLPDLLHLSHLPEVQAHAALVPRLDLRLVQQVQRLPQDPTQAMARGSLDWFYMVLLGFQGFEGVCLPMMFIAFPSISTGSPTSRRLVPVKGEGSTGILHQAHRDEAIYCLRGRSEDTNVSEHAASAPLPSRTKVNMKYPKFHEKS